MSQGDHFHPVPSSLKRNPAHSPSRLPQEWRYSLHLGNRETFTAHVLWDWLVVDLDSWWNIIDKNKSEKIDTWHIVKCQRLFLREGLLRWGIYCCSLASCCSSPLMGICHRGDETVLIECAKRQPPLGTQSIMVITAGLLIMRSSLIFSSQMEGLVK